MSVIDMHVIDMHVKVELIQVTINFFLQALLLVAISCLDFIPFLIEKIKESDLLNQHANVRPS